MLLEVTVLCDLADTAMEDGKISKPHMQVEAIVAVHIGAAAVISIIDKAGIFMDAAGDVIDKIGGE